MNKNKLNNAIEAIKNISLSEADRASMRSKLADHIEANQPVQSPWAPILSPFQSFGRSAMVAAVVFLVVGGVSMAAEQALPGDPLYAFKLNVNESFLSITSLSPTSDAVHQSRLANRRIAELETLAARGELSLTVSSNLMESISKHAASAREEIAKISARGEGGDAASLETELLSSLETHSDILADLAISRNGDRATSTAQAAARLREVARFDSSATGSSTTAVLTNTGSENRAGLEGRHDRLSSVQIKRLLERTADRLAAAQTQFTDEVESIESQVVKSSVEALLTASAADIDEAIDLINDSEYQEANPLLREALTYAHKATVIMEARRALESSSGLAIDDLLDSSLFSSSTATSSTQVGGADVVPDEEKSEKEDKDKKSGMIEPNDSGDKATSTSSSTPEVQGTSTAATSSASSTTDEEGQHFTRRQASSTAADRQINDVLERVKETLENHTPQGFLPARTSHGDEN